jgi:hypothetical protein
LPFGLSFCPDEYNSVSCNVGCRSKFYTVVGTGENMTASTCGGGDNWGTRLIVREGSTNSSCLSLTCAGTYLRKTRPRYAWAGWLMRAASPYCQQEAIMMDAAALIIHLLLGLQLSVRHTTFR